MAQYFMSHLIKQQTKIQMNLDITNILQINYSCKLSGHIIWICSKILLYVDILYFGVVLKL